MGGSQRAVGLLARGKNRLGHSRAELEAAGGEAMAIPTDVSDSEQVEAAADVIEEEFGPIEVWVNNAMTTVFSPFEEITPKEYKRATEVTYLSAVYGTMAALKRMSRRDKGAHGIFDARARSSCAQLWQTTHRRWLAAYALSMAALIWVFTGLSC